MIGRGRTRWTMCSGRARAGGAVELERIPDEAERRQAVGNRYADYNAQEAVDLHPPQRTHFWRDTEREFKRREKTLKTIGAVLAL